MSSSKYVFQECSWGHLYSFQPKGKKNTDEYYMGHIFGPEHFRLYPLGYIFITKTHKATNWDRNDSFYMCTCFPKSLLTRKWNKMCEATNLSHLWASDISLMILGSTCWKMSSMIFLSILASVCYFLLWEHTPV